MFKNKSNLLLKALYLFLFFCAIFCSDKLEAQNFQKNLTDCFDTSLPLKDRLIACDDAAWYYKDKDSSIALYCADTLWSFYENEKVDTARIMSLNRRGNAYTFFNKPNKAIEIYLELKKIEEEADRKIELAKINIHLSTNYKVIHDLNEALTYARQSFSLIKNTSQSALIATSASQVSVVFHDLGQLDSALFYNQKALDIRKENPNSLAYARSLMVKGLIHIKLKKYSEALRELKESLSVFESQKDTINLVKTLNNIASVYYYQQKFNTAILYYTRSLILANASQNTSPRQTRNIR